MNTQTSPSPVLLVFEGGFRIFFISAALYAALSLILWIDEIAGVTGFLGTTSVLPGSLWHAHEIVFGFIIAVVCGFLTTAVPVWAGTERIRGAELVFLFVLWITGRLAVLFSEFIPVLFAAAIDLAFIPAVAVIIAKPLIREKVWRNLGFIPMLLLIATGNLLIWMEMLAVPGASATTGINLSIGLLVLMTVLIGGRVLPVFTGNWLKRHGEDPIEPAAPIIGKLTVLMTAVAVLANAFSPFETINSILQMIAGVLILIRLVPWKGMKTLSDPIMWILHAGYLFLGLGLLFEGAVFFFEDIPEILTNHILTIGGLGIMIYGMMSRIALGHTGRPLKVRPLITFSYFLILFSLLARVLPPLVLPELEDFALSLSGLSWIAAWIFYLVIYVPILTSPRADGKAG